MERESLKNHFGKMGARVKFRSLEHDRRRPKSETTSFIIDISRDKRGPYFDMALARNAPEFEILQALPKERHLLIYSRDGQRFLCGHDERTWFVAPIDGAVSTVRAAKQSLLPPAVREQVKNLPPGDVDNRRNAVFKRQGEWFFLPTIHGFLDTVIHKNEPLQRTPRSKPHMCQELIREGGELVYIVRGKEYTEEDYKKRKIHNRNFDRHGFRTMIRNPDVKKTPGSELHI